MTPEGKNRIIRVIPLNNSMKEVFYKLHYGKNGTIQGKKRPALDIIGQRCRKKTRHRQMRTRENIPQYKP
jgi:hypothetical protein